MPANGPGLEDALASQADALLFTLADDDCPVAELRAEAVAGIAKAAEAGKAALVTVNHPRTRLTGEDIEGSFATTMGGASVIVYIGDVAYQCNTQDIVNAAVAHFKTLPPEVQEKAKPKAKEG